MTKITLILLIILFTSCTRNPQDRICSDCVVFLNDSTKYPVDTNIIKDGKPDLFLKCKNISSDKKYFYCGESVILISDTATGELFIDGENQGSICLTYKGKFCKDCK